jgi:hypothetical protein
MSLLAPEDVCNVTRQPKVLSFSPGPTPIPTARPLWIQSSPPSSEVLVWRPTRFPATANPTSAPTSAGDCDRETRAVEVFNSNAISFRPDKSPIQITGQYGATVTFILNQAWKKNASVGWIATELKDPSLGWNCLNVESVPYGPVRKFVASCDASGWTSVKLYVHDETRHAGSSEDVAVPQYCSPTADAGATSSYSYKVPCNPGCYPMPAECINEAELDHGVGVLRYNSSPIEIISQDWTNVTFRVLQAWVSQPICSVATQYPSATNGAVCDLQEAVKPGSGGMYVAKCQGGSASVTVYVHDTSMDRLSNNAKMPAMCQSGVDDRIASYTFRIPCGKPSDICVQKTNVTCEKGVDYVVLFEDFESSQYRSWTFGLEGRASKFGRFLGPLSTEFQETFKVLPVPRSPTFASLEFSLLTFGNWTSNDRFFARIRNQYLDLLTFLGSRESRSGLFGDLKVSMRMIAAAASSTSAANSRIISVNMTIPRRYYEDGHLMIGFKVSLGNETQSKSAGIDNVKVVSLCNPSSIIARKTKF